MKPVLAATAVVALSFAAFPALASADSDTALCAAALDEQGVAAAGDYRAKFVKSKGGSARTVTVRLIPVAGGDPVIAECVIRRGAVTEATVKA